MEDIRISLIAVKIYKGYKVMLAIEHILKELEKIKLVDEIWAKEAEDRVKAYDEGKINLVSEQEVFDKYGLADHTSNPNHQTD